jgi:hypothetical protein
LCKRKNINSIDDASKGNVVSNGEALIQPNKYDNQLIKEHEFLKMATAIYL